MDTDFFQKVRFVTETAKMYEDTRKCLGFGVCLDWRWQQGMNRLALLESARTPEEFYAGADEELLLRDKTMTDFLFPYLKLRLHPGVIAEATQDRMDAIHMALTASQEELITPSCHSLNIEAGVLAGQALGEAMPGIHGFPPLAQILYEQLFFDIRHFLDDPDKVCRLLLNDRNRLDQRGGYDWQCKIIAYGIGFEEYLNWRSNKPSVAARAVLLACKDTLRYLSGLSLLGKERPEDFAEAHCRLFGMLPDIVSGAEEIVDAGIKRKYHDHTENDIATAITMIPDMIT